MLAKIKALYERLPVPIRDEARKVAKHFVTSFTGTFLVLLPGVYAAPNFSAAKAAAVAAVVAAFTAAVRASVPVAKASVRAIVNRYFA
jgi:hypothetical protein